MQNPTTESLTSRHIWDATWQRFTLITTILGEVQGRIVALAFYYTIFTPFAIAARLFGRDPLRRTASPEWLKRTALPSESSDLQSARRQG